MGLAIISVLICSGLVCALLTVGIFVFAHKETPVREVVRKDPDRLPGVLQRIIEDEDPWTVLREFWWKTYPDHLFVGTVVSGMFGATARAAMLVLGPVGRGKSMMIVVPQLLLHNAAALVVSLKEDLAEATAQTRARLGTVWHYNPGESELIPGAKELRWSPLQGAKEWKRARKIANFLAAETLSTSRESGSDRFFKLAAASTLAMLFYVAAQLDKDMRWVTRALGQEADDFYSDEWREISRFVAVGDPHPAAVDAYNRISVRRNTKNGNTDVFGTAMQILGPYEDDDALATTVEPNFDPFAFAESKDTIYITASLDEQSEFAPLITTLLTVIRRAQEAYFKHETRKGNTPNQMHWFLDEFAGMAPLKKFPELVTHSGSTGLRITACLQDLSYAKRMFGDVGENLLSVMSAVVFPGTTNKTTTELIALCQGKLWVTKVSHTYSQSQTITTGSSVTRSKEMSSTLSESISDQVTTGTSESHFYVERCTPADITNGMLGHERGGYGREGALLFFLGGLTSVRTRGWFTTPFREATMANAVHAARFFVDERAFLPTPPVKPGRFTPAALRKRWTWALEESQETRKRWEALGDEPKD